MDSKKKILAFAKEAGGAAAIAPVLQGLDSNEFEVLLLAKGHALRIFTERNLDPINFAEFNKQKLEELSRQRFNSLPDVVFTSATSLPTLDMTERLLWEWGNNQDIHTIGVIDHWQNYGLRFSGIELKERMKYLPDTIFTMDELAKKEMIIDGIPEEVIKVTGQPAFDYFKNEYQDAVKHLNQTRVKLGIESNAKVITFIAESLKKDYGEKLGYDENSILKFLGSTIVTASANGNLKDYCFMIKLHPENKIEDFAWVEAKWSELNIKIVSNELSSIETIVISDYVIGMTSVMLIESILAQKITVSLQIGSKVDSQLVATRVGAIPFIDSLEDANEILLKLLMNKDFCADYLQQQSTWKIDVDATESCIKFLKSIPRKINIV